MGEMLVFMWGWMLVVVLLVGAMFLVLQDTAMGVEESDVVTDVDVSGGAVTVGLAESAAEPGTQVTIVDGRGVEIGSATVASDRATGVTVHEVPRGSYTIVVEGEDVRDDVVFEAVGKYRVYMPW